MDKAYESLSTPGVPAALSVAGSDPGAGAGIQADLKTFSALGVFGTTVVTAVTAQNLSRVRTAVAVAPDLVEHQLRAVLEGFPLRVVKTGMLPTADIVRVLVRTLADYPPLPLVVDPVLRATAGAELTPGEAATVMREQLFPLATLVTPNIPEAQQLLGQSTPTHPDDPEQLGRQLFENLGVPVLLKGGHRKDKALDILFHWGTDGNVTIHYFEAPLIHGVNTHGSGCTLASAIAATMARGYPLEKAVATAKKYMILTLREHLQLPDGPRIINHFPPSWRF